MVSAVCDEVLTIVLVAGTEIRALAGCRVAVQQGNAEY